MTRAEVAAIVQNYLDRPENVVGGNLHIVLDDGNLEDHHIQFCISRAAEAGDKEGIALGDALLELSMTQRKKLYKNNWTA